MKTFNTTYLNKQTLEEFIKLNSIIDSDNILLQIFTGIANKDYINNLISEIKNILPNIKIIGSTTDGEILEKDTTNNKTVLSFSIFESTKIEIYSTKEYKSSYQTGKQLIQNINNIDDAKVAIIFADGLNTNGEIFLKAFHKYTPNLILAGGLAGDNAKFNKTYVFTQDGFSNQSAVTAVLYNPNLIANTSFSFGWESIGKELTITKAIENTVYTIDNLTATEIYKKYLGEQIEEHLPATGIEFPLIIIRDNDEIARAVVGKNDDGSLVFAGNIKEGDKVHLGYGNMNNILDNRFELYNQLSTYPIESIFIYSCMARKRLLGDDINSEIIPLSNVAPTSGFFTYGEFYYCNNESSCTNKLLNQTMTLLTLSENNDKELSKFAENISRNENNIQTIKALSHLLAETTSELNDLNKDLEAKVKDEVHKNTQKELQLLESSKMVSMGEMIGNIAHQWRQPLSSISTLSTGIIAQKEFGIYDENDLIKDMNNINESSQYLSETINTFRDFLKDNKELKEQVLQDNIKSAISIVGTVLKDVNIDFENNVDYSNPILITIVSGELPQVIINIINNAKDIILEKELQNGLIKLDLILENKKAIITIEDNGGGVPEKVLPKIFDPYFTTKHQSQGTGLGLHMSYKIITESMNGELYVKNITNGAKFFIELPLN